MRAVVLHKNGGPEELRFETVPDPRPGPEDCIVRVRAASVCGRDLIDRRGGVPMKRFPTILGHEFAGEIVAVGSAVRDPELQVGARIVNLHRPSCGLCAMCTGRVPMLCERSQPGFGHAIDGAYAEQICAHRTTLVKLPDSIPFAEGSTLTCTAGVALHGLRSRGRLQLGETVLITGASGGVGAAAIQIAKRMGAQVIATTTSERKVDAIKNLGADHVLVSHDGNFHEEVKRLTRVGVDVAFEIAGPATFASSIRSLRKGGRMVLVGNIDTTKIELNLGAVIVFGLEIVGSTSCTRQDLLDVLGMVQRNELQPKVDRTLPLERAADAHRLLADRAAVGRIVLLP
jgi:acryloyl-coenzyme A reductase